MMNPQNIRNYKWVHTTQFHEDDFQEYKAKLIYSDKNQ